MDYRPLNPVISEIRLITLLPDDNSLAEIRCTLEHVSLAHLPRYTALSYFWGDADDTREISLDGKAFRATINLYNALFSLRSKGVSRLWIDAVCINQADINEKNEQIFLMGSIYRRAWEVIAWVGMEDESSARAFDLIERLSRGDPPSTTETDPPPFDDLSLFLQREYWSRVWIIQEIVLARVVIIHCGQRQTNWQDFCRAIQTAKDGPVSQSPKLPTYPNLEGLLQLRRDISESNQSKPIPLLEALYRSWTARSTDPRDKVFGILGLVNDASTYIPAPNYKEPVEDLCRGMALGAIFRKGNLDILPLLGRGSDDPSVTSGQSPSWAPRWHSLNGMKLRRQIAYLLDDIRPFDESPLFRDKIHATGGLSSEPLYGNGVLTCQGMLVGHVEAAGRSILDDGHSQLPEPPNFDRLPNPYGTKKETFRAIYCTFLCIADLSMASYSYNAPGFRKAYLPEVLRIWRSSYRAGFDPKTQDWIDEHRSFIIHGRTIESWAHWMTWTCRAIMIREKAAKERRYLLRRDVKHFILPDLAYMIESGMRLMLTDRGHIGWAHPRWRTGDALYLLKGCSVPVILRPRAEGGFLVVGDAYIQGLMNGEAVKDAVESWVEVYLH